MKYYRPKWTCGRYNDKTRAAIYYNNITGLSFFFEDVSAVVIGKILSAGREKEICIDEISQAVSLPQDVVLEFFKELEGHGLVTSSLVDEDGIQRYREFAAQCRRSQQHEIDNNVTEKLPMEMTSAEMAYTEKAGEVASVMFELTYRCSEKCIHCYNIGATRNDEEINHRGNVKEISLADYKRVIDELYELGLYKVCFTGGDPFSNSFAWELIDYVYNKDIAFDVFTNAQNLTDYKCLADYFPRAVGVSIYSGIACDHDYITRIKGSWEKSMRAMKALSSLSVPLELKCCVMRPNLKSYYLIYDICKQYGAVPQIEINITDSVEGDQCARNLRLQPEEMEVVLRDENIKLYVGKEAPNFGGAKRILSMNACGAGDNTFCITPNGDIIPCCSFHLVYGNVQENTVKDIIRISENKKFWNKLTLSSYEECGQHDYCDYCNLCAGINFGEHGTPIKAGENNCYSAKIRHSLATKMKDKGYDPLQGKTLAERIQDFPDYQPAFLRRQLSKNK